MSRCLPLVTLLAACLLALPVSGAPAKLTVDVGKPGAAISPLLYGIFFEEINRGGDGGLYGELLQNRSFEDAATPEAWTVGGAATLALDKAQPLNPRNPTALRVEFGGEGAVRNAGFKDAGLHLRAGVGYRLSLQVRGDVALTARLESSAGAVLAQAPVAAGAQWAKVELTLTPSAADDRGRLALAAAAKGTVWLDMVSLFPADTWKGHGMRRDLGEMIAAMKPAFVRFPGGCFVEGDVLANAVRWKDTLGDPAQRRGNRCIWGYQTTGGFGVHEFFQWCEDLGAEPLYVINCGMAHRDNVPLDKMGEWVQDALDLIEYARGPVTSKWGALRAAHGHPAPFRCHYLEIGNENGGPVYHERYALFHDAIKAKWPDVKLVANVWRGIPTNRPLDILDEHYYNTPEFFMGQAKRYDTYDRKGPKIYVGEYAVTRGCGIRGNLIAALGEAAFMCGMETNGDHVIMASYAPLFVNPPWQRWNPNAIVFDQARAFGTPSYHVQALFGNHRADNALRSTVECGKAEAPSGAGLCGVGTWRTQAEFKDIKVLDKAGKVLFTSDFGRDLRGWRRGEGTWEVKDGAARQTSDVDGARILVGDRTWTDYTLTLKARKLGGAEGFLILFQAADTRDKHWWNIGGWGNAGHALEARGLEPTRVPGKIETGRWYDIKVEALGARVRCWLDDKLIHDAARTGMDALYATAGLAAGGKEIVLKVVNVSGEPQETAVDLRGAGAVRTAGKGWLLTSADAQDENSFDAPTRIAPKEIPVTGVGASFRYSFAPRSVTVLRLTRD